MIVRKLTAIFLVLALIFSLTSCAVNEEETTFNGMVLLETNTIKDSGIYQHIMYDSVEKVMYTYLDGYKGGGPSVMYNEDGSVKLYNADTIWDTFILIESESINNTSVQQYIMYDPIEKVVYTYLDGYKGGGPSVMYNKAGTVKLYTDNTVIKPLICIESESIDNTSVHQYTMYDPIEKVVYTYLDGYKGGGPSVMYNKVGGVKLYTDSILSKTMLCIEDNSVDNTNLYQNTLYDSVEKAMYTYLDGYKCGGTTVLYNKNGSVKFYDADSLFASLILVESGPIKNTDIYQYIMYDPVEKVMYTFLDGYNCGGPTVLYSNTQKIKCYTLEE